MTPRPQAEAPNSLATPEKGLSWSSAWPTRLCRDPKPSYSDAPPIAPRAASTRGRQTRPQVSITFKRAVCLHGLSH